jgi:hypothetical protein
MTGARKADRPAALVVDYDCARRCQAEFDLADVHIRFTLGQMLAATDQVHEEAHTATERVYRLRNTLVRAGVLPEPQAAGR